MADDVKAKELKFEQALKKLETISERLNSGNEDLDGLLNLYEEGIHYLKICREKLAEAEMKVQILTERLNKELPEEEENG
jgi:exodeoxyribonuclease VII small subunit